MKSFGRWLREIPVAPVTGWRWRKKGYIETVTIAGRLYVTSVAIAQFQRRAAAGEFAKEAIRAGRDGKK